MQQIPVHNHWRQSAKPAIEQGSGCSWVTEWIHQATARWCFQSTDWTDIEQPEPSYEQEDLGH